MWIGVKNSHLKVDLELFLHLCVIQIASSHADPHSYLNHALWVGFLCLS
jgi:hypothetical protein